LLVFKTFKHFSFNSFFLIFLFELDCKFLLIFRRYHLNCVPAIVLKYQDTKKPNMVRSETDHSTRQSGRELHFSSDEVLSQDGQTLGGLSKVDVDRQGEEEQVLDHMFQAANEKNEKKGKKKEATFNNPYGDKIPRRKTKDKRRKSSAKKSDLKKVNMFNQKISRNDSFSSSENELNLDDKDDKNDKLSSEEEEEKPKRDSNGFLKKKDKVEEKIASPVPTKSTNISPIIALESLDNSAERVPTPLPEIPKPVKLKTILNESAKQKNLEKEETRTNISVKEKHEQPKFFLDSKKRQDESSDEKENEQQLKSRKGKKEEKDDEKEKKRDANNHEEKRKENKKEEVEVDEYGMDHRKNDFNSLDYFKPILKGDALQFVLSTPPANKTIRTKVVINGGLFHSYSMYLLNEHGKDVLLMTTETKRLTTNTYQWIHVMRDDEIDRKGVKFGRYTSNFLRTSYKLVGYLDEDLEEQQESESAENKATNDHENKRQTTQSDDDNEPKNVSFFDITYKNRVIANSQPKIFDLSYFLGANPNGTNSKNSKEVMMLTTKKPEFDEQSKKHQQDFRGRACMPSTNNILVVEQDRTDNVLFLLGKFEKKEFYCDFTYPFSAFSAFGLAASCLSRN